MTRRPRRSGWKWVASVLALIAAFYFSRGFFRHFHKKAHPPNAFYKVKRADMLISLTEEGALRALNETVVRSSLEGYNRVIHLVPEGSYVQKGDLLVELDSSGLKDRLNEQELSYQERLFQMLQATGNFEIQKSLAESQIKEAELQVENAQADLEKYRDGDAPLLIRTVEARTGVLAEQVRIARERSVRTEELFKTGKATKSELEADALILKREQLGMAQYQEDLRLIKKFDHPNQVRMLQAKVEQAKAELERLKQRTSNEIAQAAADLKTTQTTLDFLDQGLKTQKRRLENSKIFAPQNGLVVYAAVSPFQFESGGSEGRRDEGRFRMGGRGGGRGGDDGSGEFRGGGRRGGRFNLESSSGGSSGSSRSSSTAETIASGNQRIASAISGTPATEPSAGATGGSGSGAGAGGSADGSGGGSSGGRSGSSGGQNASSAAGSFVSYPSMRPSSAFTASRTSSTNSANSASTGTSSSLSSTGSQISTYSGGNQLASRSSSQGFRDFGGFEFFGTPGLLEEGIMVRNRQELIRLPDVSKMLAEIKVEEARVGLIRAGMTAYIEVRNIPHHRFKGTVRRVALLPDAQSSWMNPNSKLFPTDVLVDEELPILKPGVSANVEIIITNLTQVLSVPIQTVARLEGENVCFVKRGSRVTPVPVTTGLFNDCFVEITSGLKEGDLVLLAPISDEEIEETPPGETNDVPSTAEPPDSLRRGDPSDSPRRGEFSSPRRGEPSDSPRRGEFYDPSRPASPGQEPPAEERRMRRRDSDSPDGAPPSERRRNRQGEGRRPQNSQNAPE